MQKDILFKKYKKRGPNYHWKQIGLHPVRRNAFVKARYDKFIILLKKRLASFKNTRILDIGCGDGVLTCKLAEQGAFCLGLDSSFDAIKYAESISTKSKHKIFFSHGSCYNIQFKTNCFDAVVCSDVIEHLSKPEILLNEIRRILKPEGIAIISTPIRFTHHPSDDCHVQEWFVEEFEALIKSSFSDFEVIKSHPLVWYELFLKHKIFRILINILSIIKNPFLQNTLWKFYTLQFAVVKKS